MKKRLLALGMSTVLALSLAACGSSEPAETKVPAETKAPAADSGSGQAASAGLTPPGSPYTIQICGATSGGTYFLIANGICQLLNDNAKEWFSASAQSTGGTPDNIRLMEEGETDFAFGQAGVVKQALTGTGAFEGEAFKNISSVAYVYPNVMHIPVSDKSGITNFADFAGKTFCAGASGSATELNTRDMFAACGLTYEQARIEYTSESQSVELMKNSQASGANLVAGIGAASVTELCSTGDYHLISFSDEQLDAICALSDAYYPYTIPAGTYANQDQDIKTFAVANYIFCRADMDEDAVYMFTKTIYDNLDAVHDMHNAAKEISLENCTQGLTAPLHPGAERYFREAGAIK